MALRFPKKNMPKNIGFVHVKVEKEPDAQVVAAEKNKLKKNKEKMVTNEQISAAEAVANDFNAIKVVKKDRGLIERTESSKIVLTEDNRQVLND